MLKPKFIHFAFLFSTVVLLSSCIYYSGPGGGSDWAPWGDEPLRGSGNVITEIRPVSDINAVRLDNQGDLSIHLGETESLVVEAEENLMPYIQTDVRNGKLRIYNQGRRWFRNREPIRYTLTVRSLESIEVGSTGSVDAPDIIADDFHLSVSSTGNIMMGALEAGHVDIRVSSTGDVMLRRLETASLDVSISSTGHVSIRDGRANYQEIRISSTGNYEAMDMDSDVADIRLSSTGSAFITVNDYMEANLSSTGSVHYQGDAHTDIQRNSVGRAVLVRR